MGTYFTDGATKQDAVDEILADLKAEPYHPHNDYKQERTFQRLDYKVTGNNLWILFAMTASGKRRVLVLLYLLVNGGKSGWGYKPMDEDMGPYEYNVPKSWFPKLTAPESEYSREWRRKAFPKFNDCRSAQEGHA